MATNEERRAVATALRVYGGKGADADTNGEVMAIIIGAGGFEGWSWREVFARLADLIEPARGSDGKTILCEHCESCTWCGCEPGDLEGGCDFEPRVDEGEPPYNLYTLYEAVFRRRPTDESVIEDDEVNDLVDALLDICNAPGRELIRPSRKGPECDREALLAIADEMGEIGSEHDAGMRMVGGRTMEALARRIREACGEVG